LIVISNSLVKENNISTWLMLFSLTNELEMTINGKYHPLSNHIAIINQGDLYQINKGRNLIELKIPMLYICSILFKMIDLIK
jgi:hypothetical protein